MSRTRNKQPEHVLIENVRIKHKTDKAALVEVIPGLRDTWVPLSQIHGDPKVGDNKIYVTPWLSYKFGGR